MRHLLERSRSIPYVVLGVLAIALLAATRLGTFDLIDFPVVDTLSSCLPRESRNEPATRNTLLTLIEINDGTIAHGWPMNPLDYAVVFRAVSPASPGVVAIEPTLNWEEPVDFASALESYVMKSKQVLLAWEVASPSQPGFAFEAKPVLRRVEGSIASIAAFDGAISAPTENLGYLAAQGIANFDCPNGMVIHKVPLLFRAGRDLIPSFTLRAIMQWLKVPPDDVRVKVGSYIDLGGERRVPIDRNGMMWILPKSKLHHPRVALDELLIAAERRETSRHPLVPFGAMKDQIVLLGRTDKEARKWFWPSFVPVSRVEIFCSAMESIQRGMYMRRAPQYYDIYICGTVLLLMAAIRGMRKWRALVASAIFYLLLFGISMVLYRRTNVWIPFTAPLLLVGFVAGCRCVLPARVQKVRKHKNVESLLSEKQVKRFRPANPVEQEKSDGPAAGDPKPDASKSDTQKDEEEAKQQDLF